MTTTRQSLLRQLRCDPDDRAWGDFVDLYSPLLYHWGRRAGLQESDAADLVQEVFVILVQKLPEFEYDASRSFRAWLKTVLMNLWRNRAKRDELAEAAHAELARTAEAPPPDDLGEREYREQISRRALALMRTEFAESTWRACWLVVVENRPTSEVASELGLSENAVYVARCRVLARLRQRLEGLLD